MIKYFFGGYLLMLSFVFASCHAYHREQAQIKLIGGEQAKQDQFPAAVQFDSCTGTKIAEKIFLTAAHCVVEELTATLSPSFQIGSQLTINYGVVVSESRQLSVTISEVGIHPAYARALVNAKNHVAEFNDYAKVPDIAIFHVQELTPEIPQAKILDMAPTHLQQIVIGGYGCETPKIFEGQETGNLITKGTTQTSHSRLKWAKTVVDHADNHYIYIADVLTEDGKIALKLCPGDSGGASYANDLSPAEDPAQHRFLSVIGINSFAGFSDSAITRIDSRSAFDVAGCLRQGIKRTVDLGIGIPGLCQERTN